MKENRGKLRILQGNAVEEIPMEYVERILYEPLIVRVPGAPEDMAGFVEWEGRLIKVRAPEWEGGSCSCVVLIGRPGQEFYGMAAAEVSGGD